MKQNANKDKIIFQFINKMVNNVKIEIVFVNFCLIFAYKNMNMIVVIIKLKQNVNDLFVLKRK